MNFKILLFLLFAGQTLHAQNSLIQGSISLLPGREVRLIAQLDPISKTEKVLDMDTIDAQGQFELKTKIEQYKSLIVSVNRYKAPVYVGPGDTLALEFSSEPKYRLADSWLKGNIEYTFTRSDNEGVNREISRFDGAYYTFFALNAQLLGTNAIKGKIEEFESQFANQNSAHPFVQVYTYYSVAEMKLSNGFNRSKIYDEYLSKNEIYPFNPAWMSFFDSFYADYFNEHDNRFGGAAIYNQLNSGISVDSLQALLQRDEYLERPALMQLVILKGIAEAHGGNKFKREPLQKILRSIIQEPESEQIGIFAKNLQEKWETLDQKPNLSYIKEQYAQRLKMYSDSIPTLLITSLSGGPQLLKEIAVIEDLISRYPDLFKVIELHVGINTSSRSRVWPMVMLNKNYEYLSEFQIYSIPHFMWFNSSNQLEFNPISKPSEGLEELLYKLKAEKNQKEKIKIGQ